MVWASPFYGLPSEDANAHSWDQHTFVTFYRQPSVFLNGSMHIMAHSGFCSIIVAVDIEGNTWRTIDRLDGLHHALYQAQGHLCICIVDWPNDYKLSILILKDYGTGKWRLKHRVSMGMC
jgi:hypothetical protein